MLLRKTMSGFHHQNVLPVSTDYFRLRLEGGTARRRKETAERPKCFSAQWSQTSWSHARGEAGRHPWSTISYGNPFNPQTQKQQSEVFWAWIHSCLASITKRHEFGIWMQAKLWDLPIVEEPDLRIAPRSFLTDSNFSVPLLNNGKNPDNFKISDENNRFRLGTSQRAWEYKYLCEKHMQKRSKQNISLVNQKRTSAGGTTVLGLVSSQALPQT